MHFHLRCHVNLQKKQQTIYLCLFYFSGHMKEFFKEVEEARDLADKIDVKINEVKKLQNDILSSPKV
jgi:hypothetical protein